MKHFLNVIFLLTVFFVSCSSIKAQKVVYPKNGEGIELLLKRYGMTSPYYKKEFIRLNKSKLGKNNMLLNGVKYVLPEVKGKEKSQALPPKDTGKTDSKNSTDKLAENKKKSNDAPISVKPQGSKGYEPLFGMKYASYPIISHELKGACFYLVSGHGGPDPGAMGKINGHSVCEDEYAYDIVLRLARSLRMRGAKVHIIIQDKKDGIRDELYLKNSKRETCMGQRIPLSQISRLNQRCIKINSLYNKDKEKYKRALFVHIDSRSKSKQTDVFFYHSGKKASKKLTKTMRTTFKKKYAKHQPGRGFKGTVSKRDLHVLRNTTPVAAFVELGNIQNKDDQQRFILKNNRQALAEWFCEAFITDYKNNK